MPVALLSLLGSCSGETFKQVTTTQTTPWSEVAPVIDSDATILKYDISLSAKGQSIEGFGACFNELGWTSLSLLTQEDRGSILEELFMPNQGANFNICRMPVAANDFSTDWYSYNETDGDLAMEHFSIERDRSTLIPFIKSAQALNPEIKIWGSPWSPPTWFKVNKHYASRTNDSNLDPLYHNNLPLDKQHNEGEDMFIQSPEYLEAYALYFQKYVEEYRKEGIDIFAVMPQNEFNSAQIFPSCLWRAESLGNFVAEYLGPKMDSIGVEVMLGTMERENVKLLDTMLQNPACREYVDGVGFQWAGKGAVAEIHRNYPDIRLYQTEQECGNGKNDWAGLEHSWGLLKHYFDSGVSAYMYWNISLKEGGISRWGWAQNSLVVVNPEDNSYRYTHEYYLMKHISHYVKPGARYIESPEGFEGLVFENPNGEVVVLYMELEGKDTTLELNIDSKPYSVAVAANSVNTIVI